MGQCEGCPFGHRPTVSSYGPIDSPFVIVGEAPGNSEVLHKRPFIGPSGQLLAEMFHRAGWDGALDEVFITNAIVCRPPADSGIPSAAIDACRTRLLAELNSHPRNLIMALGSTALKAVTGNNKALITKSRGQVIEIALENSTPFLLPMLHPAAILRNPNDTPKLQNDIFSAAHLRKSGASRFRAGTTEYSVIETEEQLVDFCKLLGEQKYYVGDIETTGLSAFNDKITDFGICFERGSAYIIRDHLLTHPALKEVMERKSPRAVWQNGKFDTAFFHKLGINVRQDEDTIALHYCLSEISGTHGLKDMSREYLGVDDYESTLKLTLTALKRQFKKDKIGREPNYGDIPKDVLDPYLARDVDYTFQLFNLFYPKVKRNPKLWWLYRKLIMPANRFLQRVEQNGLYFDRAVMERIRKIYERKSKREKDKLDRVVEKWWDAKAYMRFQGTKSEQNFNPNSPLMVSWLLYEQFGLTVLRKQLYKKGKVGTGVEVLKYLSEDPELQAKYGTAHLPFVNAMLSYRTVDKKRKDTITLLTRQDSDGRVRTNLGTTTTATGRLSSSGPNLQNVDKTKFSIIRKAFIALPRKVYLELDYSQAELRVMAHCSNDRFFIETFERGEDIHERMAFTMFGDPNQYDEATNDENRRKAKTVNFGIPYGRTAFGITRAFPFMKMKETEDMILQWHLQAPEASAYLKKQRQMALDGLVVTSQLGRQRHFPLITAENRDAIQNEASNHEIQSLASDLLLLSAIDANPEIEELGGMIVILIHDSVLIELDDNPNIVYQAAKIMQEYMVTSPKTYLDSKVPFKADIKVGYAWDKMKKVTLSELEYRIL